MGSITLLKNIKGLFREYFSEKNTYRYDQAPSKEQNSNKKSLSVTNSESAMTILLFMNLEGRSTGVMAKVHGMAQALDELGHCVYVLPVSREFYGWENQFRPFMIPGTKDYFLRFQVIGGWKKKVFQLIHLARLIRRARADVIYYRYLPHLLPLAAMLFSGVPFIQEHNTIEENEKLGLGVDDSILRLERRRGWIFRRLATGLVAVTPEILEYQTKLSGRKKNGIVISNSIDISNYKVVKKQIEGNKNLVFVGNINYWHGLDRMVSAMVHLESFKLYVVGEGPAKNELILLVKSLGVQDRVCFKGIVKGVELDKLMISCDVGIGSLGIHRIGIKQACPLKIRHYLALGLPVLAGYDDVDLRKDLPFLFKAPATDQAIAAKDFAAYYESLCYDQNVTKSAREFAEKQLSVKAKMRQFHDFAVKCIKYGLSQEK